MAARRVFLLYISCFLIANSFSQKSTRLDSIKALPNEEIIRILDKKNYPNYDIDLKWIKTAKTRYSYSAKYDPRKVLNFIREKDDFNKQVERVLRTYQMYWLTHELKLYEKSEMEKEYSGLQYYISDQKNLDELTEKDLLLNYTREPQDYIKAIKYYLNNAQAETDEYKSHPRSGDGGSDPRAYYKDRIPDMVAKAELVLMLFEKKVDTGDLAYTQLLEEKKAKAMAFQKDALNAYSVIKPPLDAYKGADAASNKALVMEILKRDYPDIKILKVYLTGTKWEKDEGYNYAFGNSSASQTVRSESNLDAAVSIENKDNPKTCYIFFGKINKDNTNGKKYVFFSIDHYKEQTIDEVFIEKVVKK